MDQQRFIVRLNYAHDNKRAWAPDESNGHFYDHEYEQDDTFCPHCGAQEVWCDTGPGDYYQGSDHVCLACGKHFTWNGGGYEDQGIADQIRSRTKLVLLGYRQGG